MPLRPAFSDSQVLGTSAPTGVIAPSPVTTTRVRSVPTVSVLLELGANPACPRGCPPVGHPRSRRSPGLSGAASGRYLGALDVLHDVLHGLQVLELVVGDLDAELVLGRHRDLHHRQRVDVE